MICIMDLEEDNSSSLKELAKLKVKDLKEILRENGEPTSGKKADLVVRCEVIQRRKETQQISEDRTSTLSAAVSETEQANIASKVTYKTISKEAEMCEWTADLRKLPNFDFLQLYDYLVVSMDNHETLKKSGGFKKLKSLKFFKEGHIKKMLCATHGQQIYLKCQVVASMKSKAYNSIVCFDQAGTILKAACECVAGLGVSGLGRCNHVGGILFAVEDFGRKGLQDSPEPVSCTSQLCKWNVPRKVKVDPKPVDDIVITKHHYAKESAKFAKFSLYDPRAPCDREVNEKSLQQLSSDLATCMSSSSFFLFYPAVNVEVDSICEAVPINAADQCSKTSVSTVLIKEDSSSDETSELPFNDCYDISSKSFQEMIDEYQESVTDEDIERIETETRGQGNNQLWKDLKREKLTASNFKAAAVRKKEPDLFLKRIMYIRTGEQKCAKSLVYGNLHENDAVQCYVNVKKLEGDVDLRVQEVGTILSKERPGLGASLDRKVYDPMSVGMKEGGLEVKCPFSKRGMTVHQACEDKAFYLVRLNEGKISLKEEHQYYYQIQGQMFVCNLEWVDFVVWFCNSNVFIERIYFNHNWWHSNVLPKLDYFYKRAFLPEKLTRRVERGVKLYKHGGWKHFKERV